MKRGCFEFYYLEEIVKDSSGKVIKRDQFPALPPDNYEVLSDLLSPYNKDPDELMDSIGITLKRKGVKPWAIAWYPKEYLLASHLMKIRKSRNDLLIGSYSITSQPARSSHPPCVSVIVFRTKSILEDLMTDSPLLLEAWKILRTKDSHRHWLCLPGSPPEDWLNESEGKSHEATSNPPQL